MFGMSTNEQTQGLQSVMNNPFASYALNYTAFLAKESAEKVKIVVLNKIKLTVSNGFMNKVRRHFDVDNRYVMRKLLIILFPFLHRV